MEFINAGLFGLAALAVVPILIHLLHRPRPKDQPFPSVMFLKKCARKSRAWASLKNLLLMALRAAAVILIVFAVARPRLAGAAQVRDQGVVAAIVLDDSFRLDYREAGLSRFEDARRRALDVLATLPSGAECSLALSSGESTPLSADLSAVRAEVLRAKPSDLAVPVLPAVVEGARSMENVKNKRREIHVFTDLAKIAWSGASADAVQALKDINVYIHDVGKPEPLNAAITKIELAPRSPRLGRPVEVVVTVAAWGRSGPVTVSLKPEDGAKEEKVVAVVDGGTAMVRFRATPEKGALFHGTVSLTTPDPLAIDDVRHFAVPVNDPVNALVVEATPDADRGVAPFLSFALSPPSLRDKRPAAVTAVTPLELTRKELKDFECVLVTCPDELAKEDVARLLTYVQAGAGVAVFGGDDMKRYTAVGLFPAVDGVSETPVHFAPGTADHPIFNLFRAGRNGDVSAPTFSHRLTARKDGRWRPAMLFEDGSPAALEAVVGRGRVLAFPFALNGRWSDLPKFPCFVPMAHEIARHLSGSVSIEREFSAGVPVFLALSKAPSLLDYALVDLRAGTREARRADPAVTSIHVARSLPPGRYAVEMGGDVRPFSVNVDTNGSDPTRLSREELVKRLPRAQVSFAFERAAAGDLRDARSGRELTLYAILATVLILMGELWLASKA